ncbi:PE-PPE domain-containing protein [Nocardia miyunensis]|uniref:PE-PPE domain-containing protein n=1 Tax=Nocardia miyunensis TaxID=282684 RepID=UPI000836380C|nr:PE-PPE domain-containing protein [Nocardia miyunensis]
MTPCPITVLAVGGTSESFRGDTRTAVQGMLSAVTRRLSSRFESRWVGYPSDYGPASRLDGGSFAGVSVPEGRDNLAAAIAATDGPVVLVGYSQGCCVVRELFDVGDASILSRIAASGFLADPLMPKGAAYAKPTLAGWGVAGVGHEIPVPAWWIAGDRDPITNASPDSLLRDVADLTEFMSFTDVLTWGSKVLERLAANNWQNAWGADDPDNPFDVLDAKRRVDTAISEALAYLPRLPIVNEAGGQHTSYDSAAYLPGWPTGCELLARLIEAGV